jgi:hypothetical protein
MFANRLAFAALAVACIGAAAVGGYIASRTNSAPVATAENPSGPATSSAAKPVQETEAIVGDATAKAPPAASVPAPLPSATPKHVENLGRAATRTAARATPPGSSGTSSDPLPAPDGAPAGAANSAPSAPPAGAPGPATAGGPSADANLQVPRPDDRGAPPELPRLEPPPRSFAELIVPTAYVIGLQADTLVSSEHARVEDRVDARVTRDVRVRDTVVIPAGSRAIGSVVVVERGGKFKQTARLGIRFNTLVLADGSSLPIQTETIFRDGAAPGNESAAKVGGGTVAGAILGAILGGGKGAAIGAAAGAGAGSGAVAAGDRSAATIHPGDPVTVRLTSPVTVTVEQK